MRYYLGVDWADQTHAVWVVDEQAAKVASRAVPHTAAGLSEWGRELDEWRAQGIELWTAIERPEGRVVDFLLDHGVVVYPVNPKALDRARDRFRPSAAKSDSFDARVLAEFLRTDHRDPRRVFRRLQTLRGWGHAETDEVFPGSAGAGRADGDGARGRARFAVGGDHLDRREDRL